MIGDYRTCTYDCEVFAHDWLFCFLTEEGERYSCWNDPEGLFDFVSANEDRLFLGYNSSSYDQYILKAIMAGCEPEQVKEVNDWIIGTDNLPWEHPYLEGQFFAFNDVDLMKDTQVGTSLKSIEGHSGSSIEESSVPFDWPEPLTEEQRAEVERYCWHDVEETEKLAGMRRDYLMTKYELGARAGLPAHRAVALTNAKLTAAVLGAVRREWDDERRYVVPSNLLTEYVPQEALDFFARIGDMSVPDEELWSSKLELSVGECPVTLGFGGIHGALPTFRAVSGNGVAVVNADVASYYPSLMVVNGYCSRNMADPKAFEDIYHERLAAKKAGDKKTANALKLIVNTTYGATLNQYNDLNDPLMARSVCVSGQLYLLELACHLVAEVEGLAIVQLNTDGIMVTVSEERRPEFQAVCDEWVSRTKFVLEYDEVERIWQKDVNNYAMRKADGVEKVKGSYLVRGASTVGAFSINNDATVVARAVREYLLNDVPVEETVMACDDVWAFQMVAKASHKYSSVFQEMWRGEEPEREERQKCNRVFASTDEVLGTLYKVKAGTGRVTKMPSLPDHCLVCNDRPPSILNIDKQWYASLAAKRAADFSPAPKKEEKKMATATTRKTAQPKAEDPKTMNVWQKLAKARRMFTEEGVKKSGVNMHLEFEYFELDDIVPAQTRIFDELGLVEVFERRNVPDRMVERILNGESGEVTEKFEPREPVAVATVINADAPEQRIEFNLPWCQLPEIRNKDGRLASNPLQQLGSAQTYLRRYLKMQVLDICESDSTDSAPAPKQQAESASKAAVPVETADKPEPKKVATRKPAAKKPAQKPATAETRKQAAKAITDADGAAEPLQVTQLKKALKKMKDGYAEAHPEVSQYIAELGVSTGNLKSITKAQCEEALRTLGEMRESFERGE